MKKTWPYSLQLGIAWSTRIFQQTEHFKLFMLCKKGLLSQKLCCKYIHEIIFHFETELFRYFETDWSLKMWMVRKTSFKINKMFSFLKSTERMPFTYLELASSMLYKILVHNSIRNFSFLSVSSSDFSHLWRTNILVNKKHYILNFVLRI